MMQAGGVHHEGLPRSPRPLNVLETWSRLTTDAEQGESHQQEGTTPLHGDSLRSCLVNSGFYMLPGGNSPRGPARPVHQDLARELGRHVLVPPLSAKQHQA
jgi:hypothetical protein